MIGQGSSSSPVLWAHASREDLRLPRQFWPYQIVRRAQYIRNTRILISLESPSVVYRHSGPDNVQSMLRSEKVRGNSVAVPRQRRGLCEYRARLVYKTMLETTKRMLEYRIVQHQDRSLAFLRDQSVYIGVGHLHFLVMAESHISARIRWQYHLQRLTFLPCY
jgi:hypothetical protein